MSVHREDPTRRYLGPIDRQRHIHENRVCERRSRVRGREGLSTDRCELEQLQIQRRAVPSLLCGRWRGVRSIFLTPNANEVGIAATFHAGNEHDDEDQESHTSVHSTLEPR